MAGTSGNRHDPARCLEEACLEIEYAGRKTLRHACDAGSRESIDGFRDAVLAKFGCVDVLLNAASQTQRKSTVQVAEADWNRIMDVNLTGILRACQSFYQPLAANRCGRIINIASLTSFLGFLEVTAYAASKPRCWRSRGPWRWSGRGTASTSMLWPRASSAPV